MDARNNNESTKIETLIPAEGNAKEYLRVEFQPDRAEDCVIEYGYMVTCNNPECEEKLHPRLRRIRLPLPRLEEAVKAIRNLKTQGMN